MKKIIYLLLIGVLFVAYYIPIESVSASTSNGKTTKPLSSLSLTSKEEKKLVAKFTITGGSSVSYTHKYLVKDGFIANYNFTFVPYTYYWKDINEIYYMAQIKTKKKFLIRKVMIQANGKKKTVKLNYPRYSDGISSAFLSRNRALQKFLKQNIKTSKTAKVQFIGKDRTISKNLSKKEKQAILDTITLYEQVLNPGKD